MTIAERIEEARQSLDQIKPNGRFGLTDDELEEAKELKRVIAGYCEICDDQRGVKVDKNGLLICEYCS